MDVGFRRLYGFRVNFAFLFAQNIRSNKRRTPYAD